MKTQSYRLVLLTLIGMLVYSCQKEGFTDPSSEINLPEPQAQHEQVEPPDKLIGLGKKLENPYTVAVMKKVYQNLMSSNQKDSEFSTSANQLIISTTDYYVRFLPKTDEEKEVLQEKDSLTLFDMPLDFELEEGVAGAYHDPSIPEGDITWQYTVVPVDYEFRNIEYEILADLFLQDDEFDSEGFSTKRSTSLSLRNTIRSQLNISLWEKMENEAFRITGNLDDVVDVSSNAFDDSFQSTSFARRSKWYPSGKVQYEDNTTSRIVPLEGAKIIVKRWFKWKSDITDANGNFKVGKFRSRKVKCAIKWERHDWDIRSGSYGQAWYSFETLRRGRSWNKTIRRSSTPRNWLYASVHRGAMEYFYNYNTYGIKKPYNKWWFLKRRLHIGAKWKETHWFSDHYFTFNKIWWAAPVVVYSHWKSGTERDSRDIFATTVHELAHVSHWEIGYSTGQYVIDALTAEPYLPESWATGVEHTITNRVYPNSDAYDFPHENNLQHITLADLHDKEENDGYTPIAIDMIDSDNQSLRFTGAPNDRVSGYTLGQLEDALPGSLGSWWRWRTRLREMYDNPTDGEELDYLFREYRTQ